MQKKVLALHDLSGFGRSSLVPIIATLSAMGHQCVPAPTAVFSSHTAIKQYCARDLTDDLPAWIAQYTSLNLQFDAIYSGFLTDERQVDCILQATESILAVEGLVFIDPVMGDHGKLYRTYTPALCARVSALCHQAHVITPNSTEAAVLLDRAPKHVAQTIDDAVQDAERLAARYGTQVVITDAPAEKNSIGIVCCTGVQSTCFSHPRIDAYYPGTGDLFAAVLLGYLLRGVSLADASHKAAYFVRECISYTAALNVNPLYGVQFESCLPRLLQAERQ